jgi:hypothetical protein
VISGWSGEPQTTLYVVEFDDACANGLRALGGEGLGLRPRDPTGTPRPGWFHNRDRQLPAISRGGRIPASLENVIDDGERDVLGMWLQEPEGAQFWIQVRNDLKARRVRDILIACVDGLTGFPDAIEDIFPATTGQTALFTFDPLVIAVPRREREQVAPRSEADPHGEPCQPRPSRARSAR